MTAILWTVLAASLLGSAHCAGMCGGFVAFYAGTDQSSARQQAMSHALYHSGRLLTYALLGAIAGGLGQAVDLAGSAAGFQQAAAMLAGAAMVAWGLVALARAMGASLPHMPVPAPLQRAYAAVMKGMRAKPPHIRAASLGLASALLPCGWLYAFVVTAAGMGSAWLGAAAMAAFWLGTVPLLVGLGVGVQKLSGPLRVHLPKVTAVALVVVGMFAVVHRANLTPQQTRRGAAVPGAMQQLEKIESGEAGACCHDP